MIILITVAGLWLYRPLLQVQLIIVSEYGGLQNNDTLMSSVQKLQNFAARVTMGGVKKYDHVFPFYEELHWLHVKQKHVFEVATTIFKIVRGFYPKWVLSLRSRQAITSSVTRQRHCLHV